MGVFDTPVFLFKLFIFMVTYFSLCDGLSLYLLYSNT